MVVGGGDGGRRRIRFALATSVPDAIARTITAATARFDDPVLNFIRLMSTTTLVSNVWMSLRSID